MKIFGQVLDTSNQPMALANITIITGVEANSLEITTDLDGNFNLENDNIYPDSQFKISYLGYTPKIINASDLQGSKIKLIDSVELLQETVISSGSRPSHASIKSTLINSNKGRFIQHLQDHKFIYGSLGALVALGLFIKFFKKQ